ncbi:MAG TPA: HNH endonuclease [Candidatus Scalindua sp.]|nr:HNH endonuclease [Candidatus Scalindua sp.]
MTVVIEFQLYREKLHIHHIDYNKQNNDFSNLISLCRSCHAQTNFSKDNWTDYFQNKTGAI